MKRVLSFIMIMFLFNINVSAASLCTVNEQSELNSKVANIEVSYEIMQEIFLEGTTSEYSVYYANITITNISEDFYVIVTNNNSKEDNTYTYANVKDGLIEIRWEGFGEVTNFTIKVYTSESTGCPNEVYKTVYLTIPRYNNFYNREVCSQNPDYYLCQQFVTFEEVSESDFSVNISKYLNDLEGDNPQEDPSDMTFIDKVLEFLNNYKWYILGSILIIGIVGYTIYRVVTKKQRELGLK